MVSKEQRELTVRGDEFDNDFKEASQETSAVPLAGLDQNLDLLTPETLSKKLSGGLMATIIKQFDIRAEGERKPPKPKKRAPFIIRELTVDQLKRAILDYIKSHPSEFGRR